MCPENMKQLSCVVSEQCPDKIFKVKVTLSRSNVKIALQCTGSMLAWLGWYAYSIWICCHLYFRKCDLKNIFKVNVRMSQSKQQNIPIVHKYRVMLIFPANKKQLQVMVSEQSPKQKCKDEVHNFKAEG